LRDDPYYIIDDPPRKAPEEKSIPVVHLEDMPPIPHGESLTNISHLFLSCVNLIESRLPSLRTTTQTFSLQSFVVDKDGEMPEGVTVMSLSQPAPTSGPSTNPAQFTSFPLTDNADTPPRSQTPDPITVMRTKKKGTGGKRRTAPTPAT